MTELSPTARVIAKLAIEAYRMAGGSHQDVDSLTKPQIAGFNEIALWHAECMYRGTDIHSWEDWPK